MRDKELYRRKNGIMRKCKRSLFCADSDYRLIYIALFILAVFMHFYRLDSVPFGLHIDEAGMAYDAFCLANYSVDRYCNSFPVYFINYGGGGQSALYTYLVALLLKFGLELNTWTIRLPGALLAW